LGEGAERLGVAAGVDGVVRHADDHSEGAHALATSATGRSDDATRPNTSQRRISPDSPTFIDGL
ncbi:MAG TPA: hypothetical protein VEL02_04630, partial [Jatrophihabitantaceae bacterium]|nr:hypothetical protein [Jatrophihabitantaceae bacterium]